MWTGRTDLRRVLAPTLALALPGLVGLSACSGDDSDDAPTAVSLTDAAEEIGGLLRKRTRAVRDDDLDLYLRTVGRGRIRAEQRMVFANLDQLPVQTVGYRLVEDSVAADGDRSYWVTVETTLRLDGYDVAPVRTRDRWRFTLGEHGRRLALSSTTDVAWESEHGVGQQPWDVEPIRVEEGFDVLGIFDASTVGGADDLLAAVGDGRFDVAAELDDGESVADRPGTVVYVLRDRSATDGLTGQPVGAPQRADGLTIAIPADSTDPGAGIAGYRMSLDPQVLDEDDVVLDRLIRHELTHAILGDRGRGGPLWITEGVAEWVSVQRLAPAERRLPADALSVGASASALPTAEDFAGPDAAAWYAVSWWVCEYIATTYGEAALWALLDRLVAGEETGTVLGEVLGLTEEQLVQRGVAVMTSTYG
ncbi:hypothetical protein [Nocardioides sambongensis]|uniref:hypothetical protein n=1 Tax=Nocardioides sambongensis TaxID=2589074 RepID=UPI001126B836|nr:hypothetical protein [Nocardioides sambongensis]